MLSFSLKIILTLVSALSSSLEDYLSVNTRRTCHETYYVDSRASVFIRIRSIVGEEKYPSIA